MCRPRRSFAAVASIGQGVQGRVSAPLIRRIEIATAAVTTLAGTPMLQSGAGMDGVGPAGTFGAPRDIVSYHAGHLYVVDSQVAQVRRIDVATATVTTLAGDDGLSGSVDGTGRAARFNQPSGVTLDGAGNLYVADTNDATIRVIALDAGDVSTLAGAPPSGGGADGTGLAARFFLPTSVVADGAGNLFVCDDGNNTVRKVVMSTGEVMTIAGTPGTFGTTDGIGAAARFGDPWGLDTDGAGAVSWRDSTKT